MEKDFKHAFKQGF